MQTRKKVLATAGVLLVSTLVLAACGSKSKDSGSSDTAKAKEVDTYNYVYSTDPTTFDYTVSSRTTNSTHYANFVDGLTENDQYGNIIPSLAESWDVSDDGLTYTFHLRKGVKWVDSQGNEKADVKAEDFVTGLKHAADAQSETLYIAATSIVGLADYANDPSSDFAKVGVKAPDDSTVVYTLVQPQSFFLSKTLYGCFYPVNADFLKEKGDSFGTPTADGILYNGPYTLANFTGESVIEYAKNDSYWDAKNVHLKDVKLTFYDGKDNASLYKGFDAGNYSIARVFPTDPSYKDVEAKYGDEIASISNPKDQDRNHLSFGKITSKNAVPFGDEKDDIQYPVIEHSAYINEGSSGSILVNGDLKLVGINLGGTTRRGKFIKAKAMPLDRIVEFINQFNK